MRSQPTSSPDKPAAGSRQMTASLPWCRAWRSAISPLPSMSCAQPKPRAAARCSILASGLKLRPSVDAFFDKVTVNADDKALRENRLKLLNKIHAATRAVADFSKDRGLKRTQLAVAHRWPAPPKSTAPSRLFSCVTRKNPANDVGRIDCERQDRTFGPHHI